MTPTALLRPVIAAERRMLAAPRGAFGIRKHELVASVEVSEGEIMDDLLYPAAARPDRLAPAGANGSERPAR
ncbi:MAG TPA: hypothetical protein VK919_02675 [Solirubrobacterales bacterium]|nr:hypothetical protein [Solirubrobacterales bacterium]